MRSLQSDYLVMFLSGMMFAGSFYVPPLSLFGVVALAYLACTSINLTSPRGFMWGVGAFGIHLWCFFVLLRDKSYAPWWLAATLYSGCIIYFALSCSVWFFIIGTIARRLTVWWQRGGWYLCITTGYFIWVERWSLWFITPCEGYPFFSPFIPLVRYRIVLCVLQLWYGTWGDSSVLSRPVFHHIAPDTKPTWRASPYIIGQRMSQKIRRIPSTPNKLDMVILPESAFPYIIEDSYNDLAEWIAQSDSKVVITGCLCSEKNNRQIQEHGPIIFQSLICMYKRRIIDFKYHKKHRIPFVEYLPNTWKKKNNRYSIINNLFMRPHHYNLHKGGGAAGSEYWSLSPDLTLIPSLCSDLLHWHTTQEFIDNARAHAVRFSAPPIIIWAVNDSWFISPVRRWLEHIGYLRAIQAGLPLVYASHTKLVICKPTYPYYTKSSL